MTYQAAQSSTAGQGLGFVLAGDGIGCYDLDHCLVDGKPTEAAQRFIDEHRTEAFYMERSVSGDGIHLWVHAEPAPGSRRIIDGLSVEFYTTARYIALGQPARY